MNKYSFLNIIFHSYDTAEANLAYEEWLFEYFEDDVLRIWINPPSVIVGKHQNAMAEANVPFCMEHGIPVIRRISGGGTVYHDLGNVNFSFFRKLQSERIIDYDRNLSTIKDALHKIGYPVSMSARHDLYLGEFKISGNAQHMRKGKSLHHGTLLYDADRALLGAAIKRVNGVYIDKGVKSVRSKIANLRSFKDLGTTSDFIDSLIKTLDIQGFNIISAPNPEEAIEQLIASKYTQENWNYGYSPGYHMTRETKHYKVEAEILRGGEVKSLNISNQSTDQAMKLEDWPQLFFPSEIMRWVDQHLHLDAQEKNNLLNALL